MTVWLRAQSAVHTNACVCVCAVCDVCAGEHNMFWVTVLEGKFANLQPLRQMPNYASNIPIRTYIIVKHIAHMCLNKLSLHLCQQELMCPDEFPLHYSQWDL